MPHTYVFNGDADGLCALQQLRLADRPASTLITGVKRDIALVARVSAAAGDSCTVLDVSLDVNRAAVVALLDAGVHVQYFDHHFAGDIPAHPRLAAHIDLAPNVCTSILVDRYLEGRFRVWAAVGAFGDSLNDEARALAATAGVAGTDVDRLREIGVAVNYNAYGESVADLHVAPAELAEDMLRFPDPLEMAERSALFRRVADGYRADMALARGVQPARRSAGTVLFVLPDAAWSRRVSGTLANDLAKAHAGDAVALLSPKPPEIGGGYVVSIRVPRDARVSAEAFCRRFPTGGGRRTAAGINHLPADALDDFGAAFESEFQAVSA
ncbi:MAG TPA: DHH family phosphoesterase [Polyangia bacterium]|nr:DHH family phosphoesterase [Polyangia bacterium]